MALIEIKNLHAEVAGREILKGVNLSINAGEVHSIMGPNGSGKSTLANVLAGREDYTVTEGEVLFNGESLLQKAPEERSRAGLFLAFQYPVEIPGVSSMQFLRSAINAHRKHRSEGELEAADLLELFEEKAELVGLDTGMLKRSINEGFSGGEKKRMEVFQLALLEPLFSVLDETDSGLDIDALRIVAQGVNAMRAPGRSFLVITHYQRLLNYIVPDFVHVLMNGQIVRSGGRDLALSLEEHGYAFARDEDTGAEG